MSWRDPLDVHVTGLLVCRQGCGPMGMDVTQRVRLPTRQDVGGLSVRFSPTGSNLFVCLFAWDSVAVFSRELLCALASECPGAGGVPSF